MLEKQATIDKTRETFAWKIPDFYNIGADVSDRIAKDHPDRLAIIDVAEDGSREELTFEELSCQSNQLANALEKLSASGDRIGVLLPQSIPTALSHVAILKSGRIALPLFTLFGPEALLHRLRDSGASVVITNRENAEKLAEISSGLPDLNHIISVDDPLPGTESLSTLMANEPANYQTVNSRADDPAILIYTSGTTGKPKGALHGHRVLLGHLPGVEMSHNFFPQAGDRIWTPADWAWIGGLLDVLMPALHHGVTVVARRFTKFTGEAAFELMRDLDIRNTFLPPTALKMMRLAENGETTRLKLRSVASGGETLGKELIEWGERMLGTTINEFYGQTECNMIVSSCVDLAPAEPGVMGFAVPGHAVDVIDEETKTSCTLMDEGSIAVKAPNPVMFLNYWNNPEATDKKFITIGQDKWLLTGDKGFKTPTGRIAFVGRDDDVISSAGYRIGPAEIEDCLLTHPAVKMAGVVGKPDPVRGSVVAAYLQLADGYQASDTLAEEIAAHVKRRLAAYEFPRVVRFIDEMPLTTTGKIIRAELRKRAEEEARLGQ